MSYSVTSLRVAQDRDMLLRLWRESLPEPRTGDTALRQYTWFYDGNPYGPTQTWLLKEEESHAALGCLSFMPRRACFGEHRLDFGIGVDLAVDPKHRSLGPALGMMRAMLDGSHQAGIDLVIGAPNKKSYPVLMRAGYQIVGDIQFWVRPLRSAYKLRQVLKNDTLASSAGSLIDLVLAVPGLWVRLATRWGYTDEIVDRADKRFDALWDARTPRNEIVGEKTAAYLNWRYTSFDGPAYRHYCLLRRNDRQLVGYITFTAANNKVEIAELFCEGLRSAVLERLLSGFAVRMKREGYESITVQYLGAPWFAARLKRCGFFFRSNPSKFLACVNPDLPSEFRARLLSPDNWFIFRKEMDL